MKVLFTGAAGFIGGYTVRELLDRGHEVVGLDDLSKYGAVSRPFDGDPRYRLIEGDARDVELLTGLAMDCDHLIAGAAMIGGLPYLAAHSYELLAANERVIAATCDAAIAAHSNRQLQKVTYLSSSLVYERADSWPSREGDELKMPPPLSTYGFQKLAVEYFARSAHSQHGLPYTIVRPFNCVGVGEVRSPGSPEFQTGNVKMAMSHVVPDLIRKVLVGQDPLHILGDGTQVRPFTYAGDFAKGLVTAMEHPAAMNEDFNLSSPVPVTVLELAQRIWTRLRGPDVPFGYVSDPPVANDVQRRVADTEKAKKLLGFEARTNLDEMLDEVIPWVEQALSEGVL